MTPRVLAACVPPLLNLTETLSTSPGVLSVAGQYLGQKGLRSVQRFGVKHSRGLRQRGACAPVRAEAFLHAAFRVHIRDSVCLSQGSNMGL